jgi:hypothetical protein
MPQDILKMVRELTYAGTVIELEGGTRAVITHFDMEPGTMFPMPGGKMEVKFTLVSLGKAPDEIQESVQD